MNQVNKYRIFCINENDYIYSWGTIEPTTCPNDSAHAISPIITIVDKITINTFIAQENSDGYFETTHIIINIPSGIPGNIYTHDVSWPMDITLWRTLITPSSTMIGDSISVLAAPETTIGVLTADLFITDNLLKVNTTVINNVQRGFLITIDDGVNKNVLGRVTSVDKINNQITVENFPINNFLAGTQVKISIYVLKDIDIVDTTTIDIGSKGFKGKNILAGTILRVYYTNNSGTSKIVRWRPEYYSNG